MVKAVQLEGYSFTQVELEETHPVFEAGTKCPVPHMLGIPLVIQRHLRENPFTMVRDKKWDNQPATYLMIDPESGFAPPFWQQNVGPVTVARADKKDYFKGHADVTYEYLCSLLDRFSEGPPAPVERMTPEFFRRYYEDQVENRRGEEWHLDDIPPPL